ncbi:MAG: BamA/TamA family outer membrane protein [Candidatus Margulisbacteria bacterium]|jgi:outer membrane protein insertion porin family|nr:BamA/TamA family outer membrane protein [Candidatus Margulisiibacteriota bacterium]
MLTRKLLLVFFLGSIALAALELDEILSPPEAPTGNPIRALRLEPAAENLPLYTYTLDSAYAPGQTVTINLKINDPDAPVDYVQAVILGQTLDFFDYTPGEWVGRYTLPEKLDEGPLPLRLVLQLAAPGTEDTEDYQLEENTELNIAYPISDILVENKGPQPIPEQLAAAVQEALLIRPGDFYSELRAEVNRQRLLDLGFFERVEYTKATKDYKTVLAYIVYENPKLQQIKIEGNRALSAAELLAVMELKTGEILATRQLQKDMVAVERLYRDKDYIFARIDAIERPAADNDYTLTYRISEGELGAIRIIGNTVTQKQVIMREMDLKSGDVFNAALLREDLRNVYNLNYFSSLVPDIRLNEETGKIDLDLRVEEKKTSSVNFGGGYGQIQGWFGFADLFLDNLLGSGQSLLFKSQFAEKITSYQIRYHNPWMWDNKTSFTGKLWSTYGYNYLSGQRELRNGWSTTVGFRRTKNISDTFTFRYEDVFNTDDRTLDYQDRAVGYFIAYDSRDQWMNPTTGLYNSFYMDHSSKILGGSINASRYGLQLNQFFPLAEKQVLAFREMYDYQLGDILPAEQYYVGSDSTVRGYQSVFAKGNERAVFNIEYRYIFTEMFVGVLFYDIGQAVQPVDDPLDADRNFTNQHGWGSSQGFGVRVITPMGPIRLDYGWPQYKEFADGFLSFNMGNTF